MMHPSISVGLPVYNGEEYLERAITSLLQQSFRDFELIISDNCSSDGTERICRQFAVRDERVRYFRNDQNIGAAANFNKAFQLSRGPYFAWANHDDLWGEDYLERCLEAVGKSPDAVLAYTRSMMIDATGRQMVPLFHNLGLDRGTASARLHRFHDYILEFDRSGTWDENVGEGLWIPVYGLMRRDLLEKTGLIGSYISSDTVLLEELLMFGRFVEVDEVLFYKRDHPGRSMRASEAYDSRIVWFTGRNHTARFLFPMWRVFGGRLAAVMRSPLPGHQRLACIAEMISYYLRSRHEGRTLIREILINLRRLIGGKTHSGKAIKKW
jgi:glycosyltransferase involved in cell wall biosynthesis